MPTPALAHCGRPAQVDVGVAAVQRVCAEMIGEMASQRMLASGVRTAAAIGEFRNTRRERLDSLDLDKIDFVAYAIEESRRLIVAAPRREMLQHRQDRPDAGSAGKEQDRPPRRAQLESPESPLH